MNTRSTSLVATVLVAPTAWWLLRDTHQAPPASAPGEVSPDHSVPKTKDNTQPNDPSNDHEAAGGAVPPNRRRSDEPPSVDGLIELHPPPEAPVRPIEAEGLTDPEMVEDHEFSADREGIMGAMKHKLPEFRECYEEWLKLVPDLEGRLSLSFAIETSAEDPSQGVVEAVNLLERTTDHRVFEGCILNTVSDLRFYDLPDEGRMEVTYPLFFRSDTTP